MNLWLRNVTLLVLMLAASAGAFALRPTHKIADQGPKIELGTMIPDAFGDWREEKQSTAQIVDPQQKEMIDRIYSQTLTRTYINKISGYRIMLSIAYGDDQRDSLKMHYPEVCYPAQGFQMEMNRNGVLHTDQRSIPVRQLEMTLGPQRFEPVTYWAIIGEIAIRGGTEKKMAEMKYGLTGEIPDGLLFRVSSIDPNPERAFSNHGKFVMDMERAVVSGWRTRLFGKVAK
ncbi:MAG: EpsI family protein [Propionivibrio sp.]|nr:EpsI family protein [Propionivibrio sp.]